VSDNYRKRLIILQCVGILMYVALAWIANTLGGCQIYGLPDCARKELTVYSVAIGVGLVPLALSVFLGRLTFIPLFIFNILVSVLFFPVGTVIGVLSIHALMKYRAESKRRDLAT